MSPAAWKPKVVLDRHDVPHATVFVVTCSPEFSRQRGSIAEIDGGMWEVLGWDDHKTAGGPHDGENIALAVRPIRWPEEMCLAHLEREPCPTCAAYIAAGL